MHKIHTHYDNLKVSRDAPASVIKAAYRTLSQQHHPDRSSLPSADRVMTLLNGSYAVLRDEVQRRIHDDWIAEQEAAATYCPEPDPRNTSPQSPPQSSPSQPVGNRSFGLRSVPARLWVLAALLLLYLAWIKGSRLIAMDEPLSRPAANSETAQDRPPAKSEALTEALQKPARPGSRTEPAKPTSVGSYKHGTQMGVPVNQDSTGQRQDRMDNIQSARQTESVTPAPVIAQKLGVPVGTSVDQNKVELQAHAGAARFDSKGEGETPAPVGAQKYVIHLASLASQARADELQERLRAAGISSFVSMSPAVSGGLIRVQSGPFSSRDEAENARTKLTKFGLSGVILVN